MRHGRLWDLSVFCFGVDGLRETDSHGPEPFLAPHRQVRDKEKKKGGVS